MYLQNFKTGKFHPFIYSLSYESKSRALQFTINPASIPFFHNVNPKNLALRYCKEKLGFIDIESDIEKNFGVHNCSINNGMIDGLISLSFPITSKMVISKKPCFACHGKAKDWREEPCYFCRATGKELEKENNIDAVCASLYLLTKYLNWGCVLSEENSISENKWGLQDIFLELHPTTGIGGECSKEFFEKIKDIPNEAQTERQRIMSELNNYLNGKEQFPEFELHTGVYDFRSEIGSNGRIYVEVPGQNGCSIHMAHYSDSEITCHNVDTIYQQLGLVVGFALITTEFYRRNRPPS